MLRIISNMSKVAIDQRLDHHYANTPMQQDSKISRRAGTFSDAGRKRQSTRASSSSLPTWVSPHRYAAKFKAKTDEEIAKMSHEDLQKYLAAQYEYENRSTGFNVYDGLKSELVKLGIPAKADRLHP